MKAIEIRNLTKAYGKVRGIADLNLAVEEGEFFGFIGPNGAGKSTTIRTLLGLLRADSGSASVFGKDISSQKEEILQDVGYLPSEAVFYTGMRVRDVLRLSAELRKKACKEESERLCERLELDTAKRVEELSFGNRKKSASFAPCSISRAFASWTSRRADSTLSCSENSSRSLRSVMRRE